MHDIPVAPVATMDDPAHLLHITRLELAPRYGAEIEAEVLDERHETERRCTFELAVTGDDVTETVLVVVDLDAACRYVWLSADGTRIA